MLRLLRAVGPGHRLSLTSTPPSSSLYRASGRRTPVPRTRFRPEAQRAWFRQTTPPSLSGLISSDLPSGLMCTSYLPSGNPSQLMQSPWTYTSKR